MRRVYLVSTAFQGDYEVGYANGLARNGVPVTVIGSNASLVERLAPSVTFLNLRQDQDPHRSAIKKSINILRYFAALGRTAFRDRAAIFHSNGIFALRRGWGVLFEALWCRLVFREWWLTVHNLLPHDEENWVNSLAFGIAYKLPNKLLVHTEATALALSARFHINRERIHIVEHGVDRFIEADPDSKERIREKLSLPAFRSLLLLFGNISRYKGVDLLLEAIDRALLPADVLVLIAGRSSNADYKAELKARLASMRNADQVVWRDAYLADADIPHLLAAADCMVLPYRNIDQSGVIFAAKSAGLPMIVSDVGSFRDYIEDGRDILVPPGDIDELAAALQRVAAREPCVGRAEHVELAKRKYAWQVTLEPYVKMVNDC